MTRILFRTRQRRRSYAHHQPRFLLREEILKFQSGSHEHFHIHLLGMETEEEAQLPRYRRQSTDDEIFITQPDVHPSSTCPEYTADDLDEPNLTDSKPALNHTQIFKALEIVERDSLAIADSFTSLFASLRLALSEVTSNSVDHMNCFSDAAGRLQESVLDAATKGNRYINSCLRLNEEMKGIDSLAAQLKILRRNVDTLDTAVNKILRFP